MNEPNTPNEQAVYAALRTDALLGHEPHTNEEIAQVAELPLLDANAALVLLAIKGVSLRLPGSKYTLSDSARAIENIRPRGTEPVAAPITPQDLAAQLKAIATRAHDEAVAAISAAREQEFPDDNSAPLWSQEVGRTQIEDAAFQLAQTGAWIEDRMNGKTPSQRGSLSKKIRRALGYSYP